MPYATRQDLVDRYGLRELERLDPGVLDDPNDESSERTYPRVVAALADATVEMDGSLAVRHTLPLDAAVAASPLLKRICTQLARYFLFDDEAPDRVVDDAKAARKMLAGLASGAMVLPDMDGDTSTGGPTAPPERRGPDPVMTSTNLEGFLP